MLGMTGNSEYPNQQYKSQHSGQKDIQTAHNQSPSLLRDVATMNAAIKTHNPIIKRLNLKGVLDINWPTTNAVSTNLPTSYNAFASSLHWFLSNFIAILNRNIQHSYMFVKQKLPTGV